MNLTILTVAGVLSASSLLLVDSAIKGTALLMLAAVAAIILRRDSAATRHLVWLLAIVAMLAVPMLSAMLPQWRVLPEWANLSPATPVVATTPPSIARPAVGAVDVVQNVESDAFDSPPATAFQPAAVRPVVATPEIIRNPAAWNSNWFNALPLVWGIGFCVLITRLLAARLMLWSSEWQSTAQSNKQRGLAGGLLSQLHVDLMVLSVVAQGDEFVGLFDAIHGDAFHRAAGFGL